MTKMCLAIQKSKNEYITMKIIVMVLKTSIIFCMKHMLG